MKFIFVYIHLTRNNLIITLSNSKNKVLFKQTLGQKKLSRNVENDPAISNIWGYKLGKQILDNNIKNIKFIYKGKHHKVRNIYQGLKLSGLKIIYISNKTPISFNGCR